MTTTANATEHRWETFEGNARPLPFELRRAGIRGEWNVSGATKIALEVTRPDNTNMPEILAQSSHPDANWALGIVVVVIDNTNVTAVIGTYRYSLTVTIAGSIITVGTGVIEVKDRPGFGDA